MEWYENHITFDESTKEYVGWDETGADEVSRHIYKFIVAHDLIEYDRDLEKNNSHVADWQSS